jgi:hypothetical protein
MPLALARTLFLPLALALLSPAVTRAQSQVDSSYGPLPVFEFHSGFWINLHHTLYHEARKWGDAPAGGETPNKAAGPVLKTSTSSKIVLSAGEQRPWNEAVAYYRANYADKDPLFSTELILLKNQLGDFEDCDELSGTKKKTCDAGLPEKLTRVLEAAAPIYRAHYWPDHDRANRRWVARIAPIVREQGVGLSERLASVYQTTWPREKIRVEVSAYANASGAYTTLEPLRVTISSLDARNQESEALEVLFHEASHGIAKPVEDAIVRECRQHEKAIPRDLWHALIFYTTGEVIRPVMVAVGPQGDPDLISTGGSTPSNPGKDYVPYAFREKLYQRGWNDYLTLLTKFWQPYLDGKVTFDDAIAHMVSSL